MLTQLHIHNFTIIDKVDLEFKPGMTVLTGETGAGKSIIIDALEMVIGARAGAQVIRNKAQRCEISAVFTTESIRSVMQWLEEHDFAIEDEIILRRTINREGRSRCYLNGQPITLQQVKEIGSRLLNIHGQHEHQNLLKRDMQRYLLDEFANHQHQVEELKQIYREWLQCKNELDDLVKQTKERDSRCEFLRYQVQELNELDLQNGEYEKLGQEHQKLANHDQILTACQTVLSNIEDDETHSTNHVLNTMLHNIQPYREYDVSLQDACQCLEQAVIQMEEAGHALRQYVEAIEHQPDRLSWLENRLSQVHEIARKHKMKPNELIELAENLRKELDYLDHSDEHFIALQRKEQNLQMEYQQLARKLSESRRKAARKLSRLVTEQIRNLGMPSGQFEVAFEDNPSTDPTPYGLEKIEYLVCTNPGQPLGSLNKIVSGGELSRISLAIQVITAQKNTTYSLIFDEVDVGIGGGTAEIVGKLLKTLSRKAQVLCITHLAQVAAQGDHHIRVEKQSDQDSTKTLIHHLEGKEKVNEIARMIGGVNITKKTIAHAKEMLEESMV